MFNKKLSSGVTPLPVRPTQPHQPLTSINGCDYKCATCEGHGKYHCSCHSNYYCSGKCQIRDWALHEQIHDSYVYRGERPSQQHRRAILFPEAGTRPQIVWVKMDNAETESYPCDADLDKHIGKDQAISDYMFEAQINLDRRVRYSVQVFYRADLAGTNENAVIRGLNNNHFMANWRGPVLCVAFITLKDENNQVIRVGEDVDCAVLGPVLGSLKWTSQVRPPPDAGLVAVKPKLAGGGVA
ncbi:hypothetical protein BDV96DRAFT_693699 [Lophiotrema nucula]|uniref:MYND-type domain-containing protein n=1 Tax=Lophiotrema nucula TaxID=690887 RepID=A0A6A5YLB4_9PLEO|nr:hypothetical protein BDV96DRAFT_693699 [Lophiotrema nucula]